MHMDDKILRFIDDQDPVIEKRPQLFWKVMIIDDEPSVHDITMIALNDFVFEDRKILFLNAYSAVEAKACLAEHPDTALVLVDVVMETEDSGLNFVHFVREEMNNNLVQIVIRTGQPGFAPENEVISKYKINSYLSKTEVTSQKLISLVTTSLRTYQLSKQLESELDKRKKAERRLRDLNKDLEKKIQERTRELSRANQLKSQFLANMSHEIRTPMNGIIGMANLLLDEILTEKQHEFLSIIHGSANTLLTLINDILDLSKIEAGQLKFETRSFSVHRLLDEIVSLFKLTAQEKHLALTIEADPSLPLFLTGDEVRIKQILLNLTGNAIKFTQKGFVKILAYIEKELETHVLLAFEVEDTGPGITASFKSRLFDKFSQQDTSTTREYGGTGLGLAISKQLAQMMDGSIDVWNKADVGNKTTRGTVFKVILKIQKQPGIPQGQLGQDDVREKTAQKTAQKTREQILSIVDQLSGMNLKILLAEDNLVNQKVIGMILEKMNLSAEIVGDGEAVLEKLRQKKYDLLFLDIQMPKLDGLETARIIRDKTSDIQQKKIPIIALTALAMEEDSRRCLKAGMDQFLTKPIHPDKLVLAIARAMGI
jgi:signal transduction histidine kinase